MTFSTLFAAECEATGKKISTSKSEVVVLYRRTVGSSLWEIQVSQFKYVRFLFMSDGTMELETDGQFGAACTLFQTLCLTVGVKK